VWVVIAGIVLGVLSRVEEATDGFFVGISTHATWVIVPFLAGWAGGRARDGVLVLTVANAAYYAWIAATEGGPLVAVGHWFAAGVAAGAAFGAVGAAARTRPGVALVVPAVIVADGAGLFAALLP
jgi:hypothetical protein